MGIVTHHFLFIYHKVMALAGCPLVREKSGKFSFSSKSGNSVKWSGKLENLQKLGKSQGIFLNHAYFKPLKMNKQM